MANTILLEITYKGKHLRIGKDKNGNWCSRWVDLTKPVNARLICAKHSKSLWGVMVYAWENRHKPYGHQIRPLRKYFQRYGNLWMWQICYSDEVNYSGLGRNLLYELWDYWRTCRAAKREYKYKIGREAEDK